MTEQGVVDQYVIGKEYGPTQNEPTGFHKKREAAYEIERIPWMESRG